MIQCSVEGRTASALIDLGSEATLVRKSWVGKDVKIKQCKRVFKGVSGKTIDVIGECLLQVGVTASIQTPHIVVVVPDHLLDTDFLYGADLLGKYDVGWSATKQTFTWAGYTYKTMQHPTPRILLIAGSIRRIRLVSAPEVEEKIKPIQNIHISKNLTLRKRSAEILKFKVRTQAKILSIKLKIGNKEVAMITKVSDDGYTYLPVCNVQNGTLRLKAGYQIASYESIEQLQYIA